MEKNNSSPKISVIIPVRELSYYLIFENLPAFVNQTYKKFEVIVLPNIHSQYDLTLLRQYKWLKIIPTGKITKPAEKRNIGVQKAIGDIVAFIDDDAYPDRFWLERATKSFQKNIAAICGPGILPQSSSNWEKVFDEVLKTWIGSGGFSYRFRKEPSRSVDDYPSMNFFIQKSIFNELGGFKENYWPGEDSKLCEEIVYRKHMKIFYYPQIVTFHHRRSNLRSYLQQHANYGFHRGAFFAHGDTNSRRISYLVPAFFVLYLVGICIYLIFFKALYSIFLLPLLIYTIAQLYLFMHSLIDTSSFKIAFGACITLFSTHVIYGIMFIRGFFKGIVAKKNIYV